LRTEAFVAGEWTQGAAFQVTDPATGNVIAEVAGCRAEDVDQAVNAAAEAQVEWAALTGKARGQVLRNFFDLMTANSEDLALILTYEAGKPLAEARGEIAYAAAFLEWFSEESKRAYGSIVPATAPQRQLLVIKEPVGVAALITPWNFPSAMITRKLGPCLAAGCGAVIKPAEDTPLSALALAELADRAGVPKGLVSVLPCPRSEAPAVGRALATHAKIAKISFTGSTAVGVKLASQAARGLKRVSLELGGNAPLIVFEDACLDAAVNAAMSAKFRNSGQTCVCPNRFLVHSSVHDLFVAKLSERIKASLRLGHGAEEGTTIGPLINAAGVAKVELHLRDALAKGAKVALGPEDFETAGGNFFPPTVLTSCGPGHQDCVIQQRPMRGRQKKKHLLSFALVTDQNAGISAHTHTQKKFED